MTDPNDVRRQFEAEYRNSLRLEIRADGQYTSDYTQAVFNGYQAALQSPAVRELVEAAKELVEVATFDGFWGAQKRVSAALRTLGAGHVDSAALAKGEGN